MKVFNAQSLFVRAKLEANSNDHAFSKSLNILQPILTEQAPSRKQLERWTLRDWEGAKGVYEVFAQPAPKQIQLKLCQSLR